MSGTGDGAHGKVEVSDVSAILELLKGSEWRHARLKMGDFELELSDGVATSSTTAPAAAPAPTASAAPAPAAPAAEAAPAPAPAGVDGVVVRAQSIGVFWRAPQPGADPFVEVGDEVEADTPLGIVEVMKMMTRIEPGVRGTVAAIHVENGEVVEFDQPLITITPA